MTEDDIKRAMYLSSLLRDPSISSATICDETADAIDALLAERERLVKENERLAKDFDVARAFHDVAVKERDALRAEVESLREDLVGLESVRREQADGRDYWVKECESLRAAREPLPEEEIFELVELHTWHDGLRVRYDFEAIIRAVEQAHGIVF